MPSWKGDKNMNEKIRVINLDFVNAYLIGIPEGYILIDSGLAFQWEKLEGELASAGCVPGNLKLVIITHGDMDHIGNCAKLREKYHAQIAMHQADSFMAETGAPVKRKIRKFSTRIRFMLMRLARKISGKKFGFEKFKPDILLKEGQSLAEYGFDAKIIHIPGHTKGSIAVLNVDGDLFAGDTLNNTVKPETAIIIENQGELDDSIARLKKMNIMTVYPGHGKPFPMTSLR